MNRAFQKHRNWAAFTSAVCLLFPGYADRLTASSNPFESVPVWRVEIELTPSGIADLRLEARQYVPAILRINGAVFRDVAVKLKGHGSFQPIDEKPGFTIDATKFSPGRSMQGLTKIHLNNSLHDASYLRDQTAGDLFQAAGIPVPRMSHALVRLNGRDLGLYIVKEGFTRDFIRRHFSRADGNLYDDDQGHDIDQPLDRDLAAVPADDQLELKRLAAAAQEPDLEHRWTRLQEALDMDRFLTFMALEVMTGHWDGYCLGQNNFRVYFDPGSERVVFLPSGMDQVFSKADMAWKPEMTGLVARAIMEIPEGRERYAARFRELFAEVLVSERLVGRVNRRLEELQSWIPASLASPLRGEAEELCSQIVERERALRLLLRTPEPVFPDFNKGIAWVGAWKTFDEAEGGRMELQPGGDSSPVLNIVAGARTAASWRSTIRLTRGQYRFGGHVKVAGVSGLPFGEHQGAMLRIGGRPTDRAGLVGTTGWEPVQVDFEVRTPEAEIVLICQLRASAGEAWFEKCFIERIQDPLSAQ